MDWVSQTAHTISYAFKLIDRQRKKIIIGVLISMITTLVYAFTLPNIYRSNGIYEVSGSGETSSHVQKSGLSSIAGAVGVSLGGGQTNKGDIIVETIRSKTFLEHLLGLVLQKHFQMKSSFLLFLNN